MKDDMRQRLSLYGTLLETVLKLMVTAPSKIVITEIEGRNITLGVDCLKEDYGYIIGREAKGILALQTILRSIGNHHGDRVLISVKRLGPNDLPTPVIEMDPDWNRDMEMQEVLWKLASEAGVCGHIKSGSAGNKTVLTIDPIKPVQEEFVQALMTVFRSIGRMNGRLIEVDVQQPTT